jgi:hypothetical protein
LPHDGGRFYQQDNRYPPYGEDSSAQATVAMFDWIARQAPPWMFGVCLWKEDELYNPERTAPIVQLEMHEPFFKSVPPLEVLGEPLVEPDVIVPGPGPIHGEADFHILYIAPDVQTDWFFDTARPYWQQFRPIVTTDLRLLDYFESDKSLAMTVIAPPSRVDQVTEQIKGRFEFVWFDLIVADDRQDLGDILNERVQRNQRF